MNTKTIIAVALVTLGIVVLAYSGGLDTSVILRWLQETYRCEVVTFTADLGQGEELEPARQKAELLGVDQATVSRWESGRQSPDLSMQQRLREVAQSGSPRSQLYPLS